MKEKTKLEPDIWFPFKPSVMIGFDFSTHLSRPLEMWNPGLSATGERRKRRQIQASAFGPSCWQMGAGKHLSNCLSACWLTSQQRVSRLFLLLFSPPPPTCSSVTSPGANGDASRAELSGFSWCCTSTQSQCFCRTATRFSPRNDALLSEPASHASLVAAPALQLQPGRRHVLAGCYSALMKSSILAIHFEVMDVRRCLVAQCVWTRTAFPNSLENRACLSSSALGVKTWLKFKMKSRHFHDCISESSEATIKPSKQMPRQPNWPSNQANKLTKEAGKLRNEAVTLSSNHPNRPINKSNHPNNRLDQLTNQLIHAKCILLFLFLIVMVENKQTKNYLYSILLQNWYPLH